MTPHTWHCDVCNTDTLAQHRSRHVKTYRHRDALGVFGIPAEKPGRRLRKGVRRRDSAVYEIKQSDIDFAQFLRSTIRFNAAERAILRDFRGMAALAA